jgi:hypothetical protein
MNISFMRCKRRRSITRSIAWGILACISVTGSNADDDGMTEIAKIAQVIPNKLNKNYQLPLLYYHNQKLGATSNMIQGQFQFNPIIPFAIDPQTSIIFRPMLTANFNNVDSSVSNQPLPLQLETFFAWDPGLWVYGIGPYFQAPSGNVITNGSKQTGLGVSAAAYFKPTHWVIGFIGYNSWGIGDNTSSGTANIFQVTPSVSYTTNNAWTYTFQSKVNYHYDAGATNQLTLSGGKTIKLFGEPVQLQVGPTYMATHTPTSAKGWGGYLALTWVIPK